MLRKFPHYKQPDEMDCGPTCLRMVAKYYGKNYSLDQLRGLSYTNREGSSLLGISDAAEKIGFRTMGVKIPYSTLKEEIPLPCIAHWNQQHFVVLYDIKRKKRMFSSESHEEIFYISDPAHGLLTYDKKEFLKYWAGSATEKNEGHEAEGILLFLEPSPKFYEEEDKSEENKKSQASFSFLFRYLKGYRQLMIQLVIGLIAGSLLQLILPFLTQSVVDIGIRSQDIKFIYLILLAQLMVFFGRTAIDIIRSWILMHISSRINIALVSDFFIKLMKLPIAFFDSKMTGDIMQRINDHHRIESFLTSTSLNVLFSMVNLIIFSVVLAWYNMMIFAVFAIGSIIYFSWIFLFLKKRADLDFKKFQQLSQNQGKVMELIAGMQEIKLHNAEKIKRWQWETIQVRLFRVGLSSLKLEQWQNSGSGLINELKNILITFLAAKLVLEGGENHLTLGMMLSITYITGQLNGPIVQLVSFIQSLQDARLSLERLAEIHDKKEEEPVYEEKITEIEEGKGFAFQHLSFQYSGPHSEWVLKDLTLEIPQHKITAIVGTSGSGKTTMLKMLLKFYDPVQGEITLNNLNLKNISAKAWRDKCGVVMQEGFIFSDTIANNIAVGSPQIDKVKLKNAVQVANIGEFIESLPLAYNTKIGMEGIGLSTGQKQRILIARAVYKNPEYLFFDEATSALDANNEKIIMNNLNNFFKGRTVVIIAHRLSTVKNADQIVVLEKGKISEIGTHIELVEKRGAYFELVKNQLELGN